MNLENHIIDLKRIELDMLEKIYNIVLNIPQNILVSIPDLKSPLILNKVKRMRQKIKNKIKIGSTRLKNEQKISNEYLKPSTSNDTTSNFLYENQTSNSKYGSTFMDSSKMSTSFNQNNIFNNNNSSTPNRWFENHSDFQRNSSSQTNLKSNHISICSRERLSVNELECIVNDINFDSSSISYVQKSINNYSETNKIQSQNNYSNKEGKIKIFVKFLVH